MRTLKTIFPIVLFLGFLLSACDIPSNELPQTPPPTEPALTSSPTGNNAIAPTEEALPAPKMTAKADIPQTPADSIGGDLSTNPTPLPPNTYLNEGYQFAFQVPEG